MTPEIEALIATATRLLEGLAGQQAMTDDRWRQEWTDALAALRAQPDEVARHRRACECAEPDPVMQADRKFYCYRCSFETGARPPMLELESEVARLTALVAQSGWEPIATAPKDRSRVMLWNGYRRCIGWFVPEGWHRQNIIGEPLGPRDIDPDFAWMPLPAPPEGPTR